MNTSPQKTAVEYLEISAEQAGQRIDNFLHNYLKGVPKSYIYRILRKGEVRINKGRIKQTYRLQTGDVLRVPPVERSETAAAPANNAAALAVLQAAVLYEDSRLLVLNKPAGMAVHGGSGISFGVIEGLRALHPDAPYLELAHRLDRDTSGCLMIAKKASFLRRLHELLREGQLQKTYLALVRGYWSKRKQQVSAPLQKNILQSGERIVRVNEAGKLAVSDFEISQRFKNCTLMSVKPITGRTHQIRVHGTYAGHPLAGDSKYGDEVFNQQMRAHGLKRLFLHAAALQIQIPELELNLTIDAPLPADLQGVLAKLV